MFISSYLMYIYIYLDFLFDSLNFPVSDQISFFYLQIKPNFDSGIFVNHILFFIYPVISYNRKSKIVTLKNSEVCSKEDKKLKILQRYLVMHTWCECMQCVCLYDGCVHLFVMCAMFLGVYMCFRVVCVYMYCDTYGIYMWVCRCRQISI